MNRIRRHWALLSSALVGFFFRFDYQYPIDWSKTYIICPNHTSNLDIAAMCVLVQSDYSFIGKEALKDGLVTGLFFRTVDVPVNRESKMSSYRAFKKAEDNLKKGITMVIFPEGRISDDYPPTLHDFKNGPFRLAIDLKIPIIPVSTSNVWQLLWDDGTKHGTRPGIGRYFIHKPVETAHLTPDDTDRLRDEVYQTISKSLSLQGELVI